MPHNGPYEFRLAKAAADGCIPDDHLELIERGEWAWIDRTKDYGWLLMHRCPDCGEFGTLWQGSRGHAIDPQGNVTPSVLHSWKYAGVEKCGFHSYPTKLLGFVEKRPA